MVDQFLRLLVSLFVIFSGAVQGEVFHVALPLIRPFNPIDNQVNSNNYIGWQMYFPLFAKGSMGQLVSEFLDLPRSRALSSRYNEYRFCLRENLKFSDGTSISSRDFISSFRFFSQLFPHVVELKGIRAEDALCTLVKLSTPHPNLFARLTGLPSTIIKADQTQKNYPIGMGPYRLTEETQNLVRLTSVAPSQNRYREIEFHAFNPAQPSEAASYQDINWIPSLTQNADLKKWSQSFAVPSLKVFAMTLNLPDKKSRKCLQSIMAKGNWGKAYGISIIPQKSFLPWLQPKNQFTFGKVSCQNVKKWDFLIPDIFDSGKIIAELAQVGALPFLKPFTDTPTRTSFRMASGKPYIGLIAYDSASAKLSVEGDFSDYFEAFIIPRNRIVSQPIAQIKRLVYEGNRSKAPLEERTAKAAEAERVLVDEGWVLPVGRSNKRIIFPGDLTIVEWADELNGIPAIWKIK